jgi:hypothetical protein
LGGAKTPATDVATWRAHTLYDPAFSLCDRWMLNDPGTGVRVRFRMASGPEHVVELTFTEARLRMLDSETFATAPLRVPECVGHIEFILRGATEPIARAIRSALETSPTGKPPPRR